MDIAGAKAQNQIARSDHIPEVAMNAFQARLIGHAAMAVRDHLIDNCLSANIGKWRFARRVNVSHNNAVGVIERASKLAPECPRPGVAMRLKHCENATTPRRLRGRKRRANLGGLMRIIIYEQKMIALVLDFKNTPGVF